MISIDCLSHKFSDIQAIIFDKDGTLEDSGDYLRNLAQKRARLLTLKFQVWANRYWWRLA